MMDNMKLCLSLMHADSEDEVVSLLEDAGYWNDYSVWRLLGDNENNFSTVGNQQADAVGAVTEKIINSIDARLINSALEARVDPEGKDAPQSIREAVSRFVEGNARYDPDRHGLIRNWGSQEVRKHAELITVTATGAKPSRNGIKPCLTIVDQGEGQSPDLFPDTFLSLQRSNKLRIPFVQGKFNMGGTGALQFCGPKFNLQLVVSRRNQKLPLESGVSGSRASEWGFTVVRRKSPSGDVRSSVYEYLAPVRVGSKGDGNGSVLSFKADEMPLFPSGGFGKAYDRTTEHGSLVKLYEYDWVGDRSIVTRDDGGGRLLNRLGAKIADPALPFRVYECRDYNTIYSHIPSVGIVNTVENRDKDLVELMDGADLSVAGHRLPARLYLFKAGEGNQRRRADSGVLFLVNGQTHASMSTRFFERRRVGKSYLKNDLLVTVDCSDFKGREREDLFMNSRDRLRRGDVSESLERELEQALNSNPNLRSANRRRRLEMLHKSMSSAETVSKVLRDLFSDNRELARYLTEGDSIGPTGNGVNPIPEFKGFQYPTFVRFKQSKSSTYDRATDIGSRVTISLESDADAGYFNRIASPGRWSVETEDGTDVSKKWGRTGPDEGQINFTTKLSDNGLPDQWLKFTFIIDDDNRVEPFRNYLTLKLQCPNKSGSGGKRNPQPPSHRYDPPSWNRVYKSDWKMHGFGEASALKIVASDDSDGQSHDYFVNVDNRYLRHYAQSAGEDLEAHQLVFGNALTLIGMALMREYEQRNQSDESPDDESTMSMDEYVSHATSAMAVVLLPMLKAFVPDDSDGDTND